MIVMIDNYDSFTYNLYQYMKQIDSDVLVFRNDEITIPDMETISPDMILLSPGPGNPKESGISNEVLSHFYKKIPILGVCLGHQMIIEVFGGKVIKGEQPMHGKVTPIVHDGKTVFSKVPSPTQVTRYHSLVADPKCIPNCLEVSAWADDGTIMAVRHKDYIVEGIQFHPESIMTEAGFQMLENFIIQVKKKFREERALV